MTAGRVTVREGRFGPYVTDGETNASLRKGDDVESITIERAAELLADRRARGPATKKKAAKKTDRQEDGGQEGAGEEGRGEDRPPSRSRRADRLQQLQPVADRVADVEPPVAGEVRVPAPPGGRPPRTLRPARRGPAVSSPGWALRAGRKSASTPQWISAPPDRNQAPPRAARTGGFSHLGHARARRRRTRAARPRCRRGRRPGRGADR